MNYLSKQNIVHRDLALRNLLVTERSKQEGSKYLVKVAGNFVQLIINKNIFFAFRFWNGKIN